ncbi:MAG: putative Sulfite:cytochrome c oxidoreductase, subunit [Nitrospira sp.]|nr:putative Sulfite:cytochrome c oxidoreductase, subunit [Nitrospira sp.]
MSVDSRNTRSLTRPTEAPSLKRVRNLGIGLMIMVSLLALAVTISAQEENRSSLADALTLRAESLIIARCSVCHSPDLIRQQRLSPARWETIVEKMMHWGADLSPEEANTLVSYLSARYHPGAPDRLPALEFETGTAEPLVQDSRTTGPLVGMAKRGGDVFIHNCQACHGSDGNGGMGPRLSRNPILKQEDIFRETVLNGRGSMPAWGSVLSPQDIADVHAWLLSR